MKKRIIYLVLAIAAASVCAVLLNRKADSSRPAEESLQRQAAEARAVPVLVELFTSEGCSSCPPADEVLSRLVETQPVAEAEVIAISEHVDYWNRLGWADPFSSAEFSDRQSEYARATGSDNIYTPQMIVDGRTEFVGSNFDRARAAIAEAAASAKAAITIRVANDASSASDKMRLRLRAETIPAITDGDIADVFLAITESGLRSAVSRGENAGRRLAHSAVARNLSVIGTVDPQKKEFTAEPAILIEKDWKRENLRAVVFIQERASRRVLGAASLPLARE